MPARAADERAAFGWRFLAPMYLGSTLNPVNSTLIATALVPIAATYGVPVGRTAVLVSSLYLACAVAQPSAGKLAEQIGPRRVFLGGITMVLLGGLLGTFAHGLAWLTVARVFIGIGTSAGYPSAMVLIRRRATDAGMEAPPGRVLGGLAIAGTVTAAIGPPIGGLLVAGLGWQSAFYINVPFTLVGLAMTAAWVPADPRLGRIRLAALARRIDAVGIAAFGGTITALLIVLLQLPSVKLPALILAIALGAALVWWELRVETPFFDVRQLVSNLPLTRTYLRSALTLLGMYTILYGLTQWLQTVRGLSPEQAGLVLLPMGALAALVIRPFSARNLVRSPLILAAAAMLAASAAILLLNATSPVVLVVAITLLFGVTTGASTTGNQTALYTQASDDHVGTAAGLLRTFSYLGSIASSTITGIVFRDHVTDRGLHLVGWILVGVSVVLLVMSVADRRLRGPSAGAE